MPSKNLMLSHAALPDCDLSFEATAVAAGGWIWGKSEAKLVLV